MIQLTRSKGATSQIIPFPAYDSSSLTGKLLAGLVFNTTNLVAYYNRNGAAGSAVEIELKTATKGTWTTDGFVAVDATNMVGDYELHVPDAAFADGADSISIKVYEVTTTALNLVPVNIEISLVSEIDLGTDNRILVSADVHTSGQTVADNTAVSAALAVVDANVDKIPLSDGTVSWNATALAAINAQADTALADYDGPTNAEMVARTLLAAEYFDPAADTVANVTLVGTTTTNTDMRGTDSALLAVNVPTNFASLVISAGGSIDALVQGYLNNLIVETTAGNIASNFDNFYDNGDALTAKIVNNVGVAGSGITAQQVRDAMKLAPTAGSPATGSVDEHLDNTNTVAPDNSGITQIQADIAALNDFNPATEAVANVTLVATATTVTDGAKAAALATVDSIVDAILADTDALQADWVNGGRLDVILDSRMATFSLPSNFADLAIASSTGYTSVGSIKDVVLLGDGSADDLWRGE